MASLDIRQIDAARVSTVIEGAMVDFERALQRNDVVLIARMEIDNASCAVRSAVESAVADRKAVYLNRYLGGRYAACGIGFAATHPEEAVVNRQLVDVRAFLLCIIGANEITGASGELAVTDDDIVGTAAGHHPHGFAGTLNSNALNGKVRRDFETAGENDNGLCAFCSLDGNPNGGFDRRLRIFAVRQEKDITGRSCCDCGFDCSRTGSHVDSSGIECHRAQ